MAEGIVRYSTPVAWNAIAGCGPSNRCHCQMRSQWQMPVVAVAVVDIYGDTLQRNVFRPLESQES